MTTYTKAGYQCPNCRQFAVTGDEYLPLACAFCGERMDFVFRKCDQCDQPAEFEFTYPDYEKDGVTVRESTVLCYEHAKDSGFCVGCGAVSAGSEMFDFSPVRGYCADCLSEFEESDDYDENYYD